MRGTDKEGRGAESWIRCALPAALECPQQLLPALFRSSGVGIAVVDQRLRYVAVNEALGAINGIPARAHLGRSVHEIVGDAAKKVQPVLDRVFDTAQSVLNCEMEGYLPGRKAAVHWVKDIFPVRDASGKARQAVAAVLEIGDRRNAATSLSRLLGKLMHVEAALRDTARRASRCTLGRSDETAMLAQSLELLEQCVSETRTISQLVSTSVPQESSGDARGQSNRASGRPSPSAGPDGSVLAPRELEVLRLLAEGCQNKEAAAILGISVRTVETYRARIMLKLGVHSMSGLVRYAMRSGILEG